MKIDGRRWLGTTVTEAYSVNPPRPLKEMWFIDTYKSCVYELTGDTLRIARYDEDAILDRPHGFTVADQPPGSPPLVVLVLKREKLTAK